MRGLLGLPDAETPQDGYAPAFSAAVGRALWKPITGALLSGFTAGLVAFGAAGGTAGTGLTTDANFSYSAGALTLGNTGASHVIGSTVDSADITTGSLKTLGGLAVTKALNVGTTGTFGNTLRVNRSLSTDVSFASYYTSSNFAFFFAADGTMNWGPSTTAADTFLTRNGVGQLLISASTASSSTTTGALVVTGGVGIGGTLCVTGGTGGPTQLTKSGNYGFIAFNAASFTTGTCIAGGSSTDKDMYFLVPSTNQFHFRANGVELFVVNASGMTTALGITSTGPTSGIGYATGAGGTVTQITNKSTGVTLNTACGQITMQAAALASGAKVTFTLTDSAIAATDMVDVCVASGGTASAYRASVTAVAAGSCAITVENITAGSLSEAPVITFAVIKAVAS